MFRRSKISAYRVQGGLDLPRGRDPREGVFEPKAVAFIHTTTTSRPPQTYLSSQKNRNCSSVALGDCLSPATIGTAQLQPPPAGLSSTSVSSTCRCSPCLPPTWGMGTPNPSGFEALKPKIGRMQTGQRQSAISVSIPPRPFVSSSAMSLSRYIPPRAPPSPPPCLFL